MCLGRRRWCTGEAHRVQWRLGEQPVAAIAKDLRISESCLRNWMADADEGDTSERLTSKERTELTELLKDKRRLEVGNEILKRAAACFVLQ